MDVDLSRVALGNKWEISDNGSTTEPKAPFKIVS